MKLENLEASELEITLNPKISQYNLKSKIYPKGRSTLGMPGTQTKRQQEKMEAKKIIITGSATRIGAAIALSLAEFWGAR